MSSCSYGVHNRFLDLSLLSFLPTICDFHFITSEKEGFTSSNCPCPAHLARKVL